MYKIKFYGQKATEGKMGTIEMPSDKKVPLPKNQYKRKGYKFIGWATKREGVVSMSHLQINNVKYKNEQEVKNLAKEGKTIKLYACWRGYGPEAAARWLIRIAKDNSFTYGVGKRAHHNGCYFCGTNRTGIKQAKKGSKWDKTYCCNPIIFAALVHGANLWKRCRNSGLSLSWWTHLKYNNKRVYKKLGRRIKVDKLKPGDILLKPNRHIKMYVGKNRVAHAAQEGWDSKSIRIDTIKGKTDKEYVVLRYVGRR